MNDAPVRVPLYYDFASTVCYVTHRVMERMQAEPEGLGVALDWRPFDLSRVTGWPRGAHVDEERREKALRIAREFGVDVSMPPLWIDSRPLHVVALALAGTPKEAAWRERVWSAIFEAGEHIADVDDVVRLGVDLDLAVAPLLAAAGFDALDEQTRVAYESGVSGVPTLSLDGWFLPGLQDERTIRMTLARFLEKRAARRRD